MKRPLLIFYILVVYVFLSFLWWGYLLLESQHEIYDYKEQLAVTAPDVSTEEADNLPSKYRKRVWMIVGEGSVFLLLLIGGVYMIHRGFGKEARLNRQQKNFLLSVTHELRSPLSSVRLALQTLQKHKLNKDRQSELLDQSVKDIDRLQELVANLLLAARLEQGKPALSRQRFNLSDTLYEVVEQTNTSRIAKDIQPNIVIHGSPEAWKSVVHNLLENALKYSPDKSQVQVRLFKANKYTCLEVADRGAGIPDREKPHIFKKFYRVGKEETRETKGTGLGLYIVKQIVEADGGEVTVRDHPEGGTVFRVRQKTVV